MTTLWRNLLGMPTTPQPTDHSDSTERKETAITTSNADTHPEADPGHEPTGAPPREGALCPCGALADRHDLCRKCRARATWNRRQTNRGRRFVRPSSSPRRAGRGPSHPRGRRLDH